jgi:PAS domain S-box-containing protein
VDDKEKTKEQLINEIIELRKRVKELEGLGPKYKEAEQSAVESEKKYHRLINNIPDTIVEIDTEGNFSYISPQVFNKSGFTPEEMLGINAFEIVHPDDIEKILENMEKALKDKTSVSLEYRSRHKDGHYYPVSSKGSLIDEEGEVRFIGTVRDISAKKQAEKKIIEEYSRAELYLDILSHDITNQCQAIISTCELLLLNNDLAEDIKFKTNNILTQTKTVANLISTLKKLSVSHNRKFELNSIDISKMLIDSIENVQSIYPDRKIEINHSLADMEIWIMGSELLKYVFDNILNNAVKYTHRDEITIEISNTLVEDGKFWKLEFKDNGPGMPEDLKTRIFNRFERGEEGIEGSGLGLAIAQRIVSKFGGKIWIEDKVKGEMEKGSNFVILLPKNDTS